MTELEQELSWLVFTASKEPGMSDAEHVEFKRIAWERSKRMASESPEKFSELPAMLTRAMRASAEQNTLGPQ